MEILAPPAGAVTLGLVGVAIFAVLSRADGGVAMLTHAPSVQSGALMPQTLNSTPADDGFSMPAEWAPHAGCWMLWPERPDNWRLGAKPAQQAFATLATAIAASEPVTVGVSAQQFGNARCLLPANVRVVEMSHDDAWMRDVGPTFVVNDKGGRR